MTPSGGWLGRLRAHSTTSTGTYSARPKPARAARRAGRWLRRRWVLHQWRHPAAWREELYDRLEEFRHRYRDATVDRLADELIASPVFVAATNDLERELVALAVSRRSTRQLASALPEVADELREPCCSLRPVMRRMS
jgi:hypothetical protein